MRKTETYLDRLREMDDGNLRGPKPSRRYRSSPGFVYTLILSIVVFIAFLALFALPASSQTTCTPDGMGGTICRQAFGDTTRCKSDFVGGYTCRKDFSNEDAVRCRPNGMVDCR